MTAGNSFLMSKAAEIRRDVVRMIGLARSGWLSASLSIVDILVWLYWEEMSVNPSSPWLETRDRFVLGRGEGAPALYATLAGKGFYERDELWSYRRLGAMLQGYPLALRIPGVDAPGGGSRGMGLGIANGLALSLRGRRVSSSVFCLTGEDDAREGVFWEAAASSPRFGLDNLVLLFETRGGSPSTGDKLRSFGWRTEECDGHDFASIGAAFKALSRAEGPLCIFARTVLGKGVSFLEGDPCAERKVPDRERVDMALSELNGEGVL
ncbi:MAG: transketolase [Synergistaceae bacterium]|nr:transketolase [Synergistota bacterium]NLM72006.1 transketolase [Synergistaceae bacterium]